MDNNAATATQTVARPAVVTSADAKLLTGWSWGAFMLGPAFIIAVKRYVYLLFYLLYFVPVVNFFAFIIIGIFLGKKGREMAYESTMFATDDEATGFIKAIDFAGKVMFFVSLIFFVVFFLIWISMFGLLIQGARHTTPAPSVRAMQYR